MCTSSHPPRNNAMKTRGKPFQPGNPGRPPGARHKITLLAEKLMEEDAEAVSRRVIDAAKTGDMTAARLVLERVCPVRKGRPVRLELPAINSAADLPAALGAVLAAMGDGEVTPEEALIVANTLEAKRRMIETVELEQRIAALEQKGAG